MIVEILGAGVAAVVALSVFVGKANEKFNRAEREKNIQSWQRVNASLWWKDGIPQNKKLVIDSSVLMSDTMQMSFWFRMVLDQAKSKGWKILIPTIAYDEIAGMSQSDRRVQVAKAKHRVSRFQDVMGSNFQFLGKIQSGRTVGNSDKEIINFMLSEEGKNAILFTFDRDLKVRLTEMAREKGILIEKIRTSDNLLSHCEMTRGKNMYDGWKGDIENLPSRTVVNYVQFSAGDQLGGDCLFECIGIDLVRGTFS